jgi:hypothetical protein
MAMTEEAQIRGAFDRARSRLALVHFIQTTEAGYDLYAVGSSTDVDSGYVVCVRENVYTCTCQSELRPACWHRAAVAIRRANDRARAEHEARQQARPWTGEELVAYFLGPEAR